jgi:hypothetical protein
MWTLPLGGGDIKAEEASEMSQGTRKRGELKNLHAGLQQDSEIALAPLNQRSDLGF